MQIFLSYAAENRVEAEEICHALRGAGHRVFFDKDNLVPGTEYHSRIRKAIRESDIFVFLISPYSMRKGCYALTELKFAKKKWPEPWGAVLPVMVEAIDYNLIDRYLTAITILEPSGNIAAEVAADLEKLLERTKASASSKGHRGILHEPKPEWVTPVRKNQWLYKVIAFDLDGTLLRGKGFQFSWDAVWSGLGYTRGTRIRLKREYRRKAQSSSDDLKRIQAYREWCQKACSKFKARNLTRQKLASFIAPLKLTRNFKPALSRMRSEGFVLAIISGGINCFLEQKVPDFRELFDCVFINELKFDNKGVLSDVIATEFDFEGKTKALEHVCKRAECTTDEAVFVGDAFNDESIMVAAGLSIACPPRDRLVRGVSQKLEDKDNLNLLLQHVCVK